MTAPGAKAPTVADVRACAFRVMHAKKRIDWLSRSAAEARGLRLGIVAVQLREAMGAEQHAFWDEARQLCEMTGLDIASTPADLLNAAREALKLIRPADG
jgi:hypothetical protein